MGPFVLIGSLFTDNIGPIHAVSCEDTNFHIPKQQGLELIRRSY